jgi:hypothetical protein
MLAENHKSSQKRLISAILGRTPAPPPAIGTLIRRHGCVLRCIMPAIDRLNRDNRDHLKAACNHLRDGGECVACADGPVSLNARHGSLS